MTVNLSIIIKTLYEEYEWLKRLQLRLYKLENYDITPIDTFKLKNEDYDSKQDDVDVAAQKYRYFQLPVDSTGFFAGTKNNYILTQYFDKVRSDNVVNMNSIFKGSTYFDDEHITINLKEWNTSKVTDMSYMFNNAHLRSINFDDFDLSSVTDMNNMFSSSKLTSINLKGFKAPKLQNMSNMFNGSELGTLLLSGFNAPKLTDISGLCYGCSSLTSINLKGFKAPKLQNMSYMFYNCDMLRINDLSNFNTSSVTNMSYMFNGCSQLLTLNLASFNTLNVTNMSYMFNGCTNLGNTTPPTSLNLPNFNLSNVTDMSYMFNDCKKLTKITICINDPNDPIELNSLTTTAFMFDNCEALETVEIQWQFGNESKFETMQAMFATCKALKGLNDSTNISDWNTSSVNIMQDVFFNCESLETLDLSSWNTNACTNFKQMFCSCNDLQSLTLSANFVINNNVTNKDNYSFMFDNTPTKTSDTESKSITIYPVTISASEVSKVSQDTITKINEGKGTHQDPYTVHEFITRNNNYVKQGDIENQTQ